MSIEKIWIVIEEGVYRHSISGAFTTQEACERAALQSCEHSDGYHQYLVAWLPVDPDDPLNDATEVAEYSKTWVPRWIGKKLEPNPVKRRPL